MFLIVHEKKLQEYTEILKKILPHGASLVSFDYKNVFFDEDYKVRIEYSQKEFVFYSENGNIYYNGKLYCYSGYHYLDKQSTFGKLTDVIKEMLN